MCASASRFINDVIMCSNEKSWPRKKTGQAIVARLLHVDMYDEAGSMWFSVKFFWFTDTVFGNWTVDPTLNETCHSQNVTKPKNITNVTKS